MNKKYKLPINIYIILEQANPTIYTSNVLQNNHFVVFMDSVYLKSTAQIFKNEVNFSKSFLVENSAVDALNYEKHTNDYEIFLKIRGFWFFMYFIFIK